MASGPGSFASGADSLASGPGGQERRFGFWQQAGFKLKITAVWFQGVLIHLWELRYWFDNTALKGSGKNLLHHLIIRRESQWKEVHKKIWPEFDVAPIIQAGLFPRQPRGPLELAVHQPAPAAPTSMFVAILVWSVACQKRDAYHRIDAANMLRSIINTFLEDARLPAPLAFASLRQVRDFSNMLPSVSVEVRAGAMIDTSQFIDWSNNREAQVVHARWLRQLHGSDSRCSAWLRSLPEWTSVGEFVVVSLLQHAAEAPLFHDNAINMMRQIGDLLDERIEHIWDTKFDHYTPLKTRSGNLRRVDPEIKQPLMQLAGPRGIGAKVLS